MTTKLAPRRTRALRIVGAVFRLLRPQNVKEIAGIGLLVYGVYLVFPPAAAIAAGLGLILLAQDPGERGSK